MKRILLLLLALGAVCSLNAKTRKCLYRVTVTGKRAECPVVIRDVPEWAQSAVVSLGGVHRIPSQLDRELGELVFVSDISGSQNFQVLYSSDPDKRVFKKRVHAQMWLKNPDKTLRAVGCASSEKNDMYHKLHHHGPDPGRRFADQTVLRKSASFASKNPCPISGGSVLLYT